MSNFAKPKFITFEGGEGSGKSTQSKMLHEYLLSKNVKSVHTREVGGTEEAEKIRQLLIYCELLPLSELMLVMAARYEHINKVIIPSLLSGSWVICDRFVDSTACYQSGESGLTMDDIYELHEKLMKISYDNEIENIIHPSVDMHNYATHGVMPDLTFFMDVPPEIGLKRAGARGEANKFEGKKLEFHQKIYERFKSIETRSDKRFITIDAAGRSINEIHLDIIKLI